MSDVAASYEVRVRVTFWEGSTQHTGELVVRCWGKTAGQAEARIIRCLPSSWTVEDVETVKP